MRERENLFSITKINTITKQQLIIQEGCQKNIYPSNVATHCHNQLIALLYNKQEKKKTVTIKQKSKQKQNNFKNSVYAHSQQDIYHAQ